MVRYQSITAGVLATALSASAYTYTASNTQAARSEKQFSQEFLDGLSVLKHYGGNGPYSMRFSYGIERDPPTGCEVDQVIMIHRHGERYPEASDMAAMNAVLAKIYSSGITEWKGDLAFLNKWTSYFPNQCDAGQESFSGAYAGLLSTYRHGNELRYRYGHLWDGESILPIFSSGYERVIESARKFGEGFLGYNYSTNAAINIIPEAASQGADSLTPTCDKDDDLKTCDSLTNLMPAFDVAADRLNSQNPGLKLNASDIYNLMEMAAYELNVRSFSDWVGAFTLDEWASYGYTQDLQYYYCSGPGDKNMNAVGAVYLNASLTLLNEGPEKSGSLFFNFAHDTNITPIIAALHILDPSEDLPVDKIAFGNPWSSSNIVPQSAQFIIERLTCNATALSPAGTYVRLVLNEAVVPFNLCQDGPGYSCSLEEYTSILHETLPNYVEECHVPKSYPQYLKFWWDYNTTTTLNYQDGPISCALTTTDV